MTLRKIDESMIDDKLTNKVNNMVTKTDELTTVLADTANQVGVNPLSFGAKGDGIADDTQAFINANVLFNVIRLPRGKIFRLDNYVPKEGTTIFCEGATIARHSRNKHSTTNSSAAIVIANKNIRIIGGRHIDMAVLDSFSGSILIESGSVVIDGALIENSWGGIFGHELQNGDKEADYVSIINCEIRNCSHNTYLADIINLLFSSNHSHHSLRDGLRTYRNVKNITVNGNHLYNNGDGTYAQSQDGMDLFYAGDTCIITNNFIYGNKSLGIDIKRNSSSTTEATFNQKMIIKGNHIFGNTYEGIKMFRGAEEGYINDMIISENQIYDNGTYGILFQGVNDFIINHNIIRDNGNEGLRVEDSIKGGKISDNIVKNNARINQSVSFGIFVTASANKVNVMNNTVYSDTIFQKNGISYYSNGIMKDNDVYGHSTTQISGYSPLAIGKNENILLLGTGAISLGFIAEKPCIVTGISLALNGTGTFSVEVSKRRLDGTFERALFLGGVTVDSGYKTYPLDISAVGIQYLPFVKDQSMFVKVTNGTGTFTSGTVKVSYID